MTLESIDHLQGKQVKASEQSCHGHDEMSVEEERKRIYSFYGMIITIPVVLCYGLYSWLFIGNYVDAGFNFALGTLSFILSLLLKTTTLTMSLFRIGATGVAVMMVYAVGFGLYGEGQLLWLMIFPLVVFFLFGVREGFVWIFLLMAPAALFLYFPALFNTNIYDMEFLVALPVAIFLSVLLSWLLESLRAHFYHQLEMQRVVLRETLADVKELNGLLPICASCKRIRNDEGYWQSVEHYLASRTNATFSHGICNNCLKRDEPGVYEALVRKGKIKPADEHGTMEESRDTRKQP